MLGVFDSWLLEAVDRFKLDGSFREGLLRIASLFRLICCLGDCDREGILPSGGKGLIGGKLKREESLDGSAGSEEDPEDGNEDNAGS